VTGDLSLKRLLDLTTEGTATVTAKDWEGYCQHVEQLEQQYWERDGVVADVIDTIIIANPNESSDDEETLGHCEVILKLYSSEHAKAYCLLFVQ
jgi:hypothetical protein